MRPPVPEQALLELLAGLPSSRGGAPLLPEPRSLLDLRCAAEQARRFKVDVSFALRRDGADSARFSVNDKGEESAFRARALDAAPRLGLPRSTAEAFFALSPPGRVQTTLSVKWRAEPTPDRVGLYYEELVRDPDGAALIGQVTRFGLGVDPPEPPEGFDPVAVCLDLRGGEVVGSKDYWMGTERPDAPIALPEPLSALRDCFPFDPERATRRFLLARRIAPDGRPGGAKLMWMSEAHTVPAATRAWEVVAERRSVLGLPDSGPARQLDRLAARAFDGPGWFFYPDLVSVNLDAEGRVEALVVYVSVK